MTWSLVVGRKRALLIAALLAGFVSAGTAGEERAPEAPALPVISDLMRILRRNSVKAGDPAHFEDVFTPIRTELATLSPDGRLLAYTERVGIETYVHIIPLDDPTEFEPRKLLVSSYDQENSGFLDMDAPFPPVRWLQWGTPTRLLIECIAPDRVGTLDGVHLVLGSTVGAIDADGSDFRVLARTRDEQLMESAKVRVPELRVVGLDPMDANRVVVGLSKSVTREGSRFWKWSVFGSLTVDVATGTRERARDQRVAPGLSVLLDPRGKARAAVERTNHPKYPQPFFYLPPDKPEQEIPLDEIPGLSGFSLSPETFFGERSVPLGFDADGTTLYYASNVGRDTFGIYAVDLASGKRLPGMLESDAFDLWAPEFGTFDGPSYLAVPGLRIGGARRRWHPSPLLVMDRFTHRLVGVRYEGTTRTAVWYRPEFQEIQDWLATNRPGRSAEILEWDEALERVLVREQGPADAGSFYVLDRKLRTYRECVRRGSAPEDTATAQVERFSFSLPDGSVIDGVLALPRESRLSKTPLMVLCPDVPWERRGATYSPELEAFTRMGLAAVLYNGRGAWGRGIKERRKLFDGYEEVQAADVVAVVDHLVGRFGLSPKRVGLFGQSHGGHVALRALQLHPERFRCAVTIEALIEPGPWFDTKRRPSLAREAFGDETHLRASPLIHNVESIKVPVFSLAVRKRSDDLGAFHANYRLIAAVQKTAPDSEFFEFPDQRNQTPKALAAQWARIESFINLVMYDWGVKFGELEVVPEDESKPPPAKPEP